MKKALKIFIFFIFITFVLIFSVNFYVLSFSKGLIFSKDNFKGSYKTGLVLGASVNGRKGPSDILKDRLNVALNTYKKGFIKKIIVSGDNSTLDYNEPIVMKDFLVKNGVKREDIYLDYAGFDTYDSLYRAKYIFGVKELIIFTQEFHLKRALYISNKLGIKSIGIETDLHKYMSGNYYLIREFLARLKAFIEVDILKSEPKFLGDKINIA